MPFQPAEGRCPASRCTAGEVPDRPGARFVPQGSDETDLHSPRRNGILNALPESELTLILGSAKLVAFKPRESFGSGRDGGHTVVFPISGVVSIAIELEDGRTIDSVIVGAEGVAGISPFADVDTTNLRVTGKIRGEAFAIEKTALFGTFSGAPTLSGLVLRYLGFIMGSMGMTLACTRFHETHEQYARWLLDLGDRAGLKCLPMTQALLADTLGVRRATITSIAVKLRNEGIIGGGRGEICLLDRRRLESLACECYAAIRKNFWTCPDLTDRFVRQRVPWMV